MKREAFEMVKYFKDLLHGVKFPPFCGTQRFSKEFSSGSYPEPDQSDPHTIHLISFK
jgi:hypothetical protein